MRKHYREARDFSRVRLHVYEKIFLITAYSKGEKDNLTDSEKKEIKQLIGTLERQLEGKD